VQISKAKSKFPRQTQNLEASERGENQKPKPKPKNQNQSQKTKTKTKIKVQTLIWKTNNFVQWGPS
jgi:hypothetical protein